MSDKKYTYANAGPAESMSIKVADPSTGFNVLPNRTTTEAQAEAGFLGKRLLIHSDQGTIGLDVWTSNQAQLKEVVKSLSDGGEVTLHRHPQHRYNEEGLKDIVDGVPSVFYNWSLPRVGTDAEAAIAEL